MFYKGCYCHPAGELEGMVAIDLSTSFLRSLRSFAAIPTATFKLNVLGIVVILGGVAGFLAFEIDLVFLHVSGKHVVRAHAQHLGHADEEMKQVDDFNARILLVELLIFGPPLPGDAIG